MNCKLGDMAIVIGNSAIAGRIVEVFAPCPRGVRFCLPDGHSHEPVTHEWIVRFQNPVEAPVNGGRTRTTIWAPAPDGKLRPITGLPVEDESTEDLKEPA